MYKKNIIVLKLLLSSICINGAIQKIIPQDAYCDSRVQGLINIDTSSVIPINFASLQPKYFNDSATSFTLINDGTKLQIRGTQTTIPQISGGPLKGSYKFSKAHFHWGENDTVGSEHSINKQRYPVELHLEFFNIRYSRMEIAQNYGDGVVIIAFFFKISSDDNAAYSKYFNMLSSIQQPNTSVIVTNPDSLASLIPNPTTYYVYKGATRFPSKFVFVTWLIINDNINVSSKQVAMLRTLKGKNGKPITNNYDDQHPLNLRNVYTNSDGRVVSPGMF